MPFPICSLRSIKQTVMMTMMMIFIDCNWISSRWQWSVVLYRNGKETAQKEKQYKTQDTRDGKQKYNTKIKYKKNIKKTQFD